MHFLDLSSAEGSPHYPMKNALYVGWLDPEIDAPSTGAVPEEFLTKLKRVCVYSNNAEAYRGFHGCPFCKGASCSTTFLVRRNDGVRYYFPGLIVHYVEEHAYSPPQEFIDAIMAMKSIRGPRTRERRLNVKRRGRDA